MSHEDIKPLVPNFTATGFEHPEMRTTAAVQAQLQGVQALQLNACVQASYDSGTNQICFSVPIFGKFCVPSPIHIPVGGDVKACVQTCGSIIPTGLRVSIYFNGNVIWNGVVWGSC